MRDTKQRSCSLARGAVICAVLLGLFASAVPCLAGESGVLKLKVRLCDGRGWLSDAEVDVTIYRPGEGEVDSASGYTDGDGYIDFTFTDLENADQARVTVTPEGKPPDDGHIYYWVSGGRAGWWDLGIQGESTCEDSYYDEGANIILLLYD
jgi:hypothetical protein